MVITPLVLIVETRNKNQNVQSNEFYNSGSQTESTVNSLKVHQGKTVFVTGAHNSVIIKDRGMK